MDTMNGPSVEQRLYTRAECVIFRGTRHQWGEFSNMHPGFPLKVNDIVIGSTEALYQACRFPSHPDLQREVLTAKKPMAAKMAAHSFLETTRPDWDEVKIVVMTWVLLHKIIQNPSFAKLLLSTGTKPIVEDVGDRDDLFWGAKGGETLVGCNILGELLILLRWALRRGDLQRGAIAANFPNALLFGETIQFSEIPGENP